MDTLLAANRHPEEIPDERVKRFLQVLRNCGPPI